MDFIVSGVGGWLGGGGQLSQLLSYNLLFHSNVNSAAAHSDSHEEALDKTNKTFIVK